MCPGRHIASIKCQILNTTFLPSIEETGLSLITIRWYVIKELRYDDRYLCFNFYLQTSITLLLFIYSRARVPTDVSSVPEC